MKTIAFVTGNDEKMHAAELILRGFGIQVAKTPLDIDEIQHHEPVNIGIAKAKSAYDKLQKPLVINDSSWSIPALGGFPGGYMKDVMSWLSTDDFMALMKDKTDKRIFLTEVTVYIDERGVQIFEALREGKFIDAPTGKSYPSFARLVKMDGNNVTISQLFDQGKERHVNPAHYEHWTKFGAWYVSENNHDESEL